MNVGAEVWKELLHGVCWDESGDWVLLRGFPRAGVSVTEEFRGAKAPPPMLNASDANGLTDDNTIGKINKKRNRPPSPADTDTSQCRWEPDKGIQGYHDLFSQRREPGQFFRWKPEYKHAEMPPCPRDFAAGCPVQRWRLWVSSHVWRDS